MTRIALILISEISGFFYYLFQLTESKVDAFDKYGPLSVAALAILANFYFLKMFIDREKKRDEQNAKRDESTAGAMKETAKALTQLVTIISERLPK